MTGGKILLIVGAVLVVAGLLVGALMTRIFSNAQANRSWPATTGQVVGSRMETDRSNRRRQSSGQRSRRRTSYDAIVRYSYTVGGQSYTNDQLSAATDYFSSSNQSRTRDFLNRHPVGASVTVFYNPRQPGSSVLERGGFGAVQWGLLLGLAPLLAGLGALALWQGRGHPAGLGAAIGTPPAT